MAGFVSGAPYFFICRKCKTQFQRKIKFGIICPKCKSLQVVSDKSVCK